MLEQELKRFKEGHELILFLCIGNDMRGDDAVGPLMAKKLTELFKGQQDLMVINAETVPENYTGLIRKEKPSHIIFVDAVEMKMKPGQIRLVKSNEIGNYSISTHAMPLSFMIKYLESFTNAKMVLIGIQPKSIEMYQKVSKEVERAIEKLTEILFESFTV